MWAASCRPGLAMSHLCRQVTWPLPPKPSVLGRGRPQLAKDRRLGKGREQEGGSRPVHGSVRLWGREGGGAHGGSCASDSPLAACGCPEGERRWLSTQGPLQLQCSVQARGPAA